MRIRHLLLFVAFFFNLALISAGSPIMGQVDAQPYVSIEREVGINEFGYVKINDTITIVNSDLDPITPKSFEITYPSTHVGYSALLSESSSNKTWTVMVPRESIGANSTRLTISPDIEIGPGKNLTFYLRLYLGDLVTHEYASTYRFLAPLIPSTNIAIDMATSVLTLPQDLKLAEAPSGFVKSDISGLEVWRISPRLISPDKSTTNDYALELVVKDPQFSVLKVVDSSSEILISSSHILVKEYFRLANEGRGNISTLRLNLLDKSVERLEVIPISEPPLSNTRHISLKDSSIRLEELFKGPLAGGEKLTLAVQYDLPDQYITNMDYSIQLTIPGQPVLDVVVEKHTLQTIFTSNYQILSGNSELMITDASPLAQDILELSIRPGVAFATSDVMPVASTVFVIALASILIDRIGLGRKAGKEGYEVVAEMAKLLEEKIVMTRQVLDPLKTKGVGGITRRQIDDARKEMDHIRSRLAARIGELKPAIVNQRPDLKEAISKIGDSEREFDRSASDLFQLYRQNFAGKTRRETFDRLERDHLSRLNRIVESLLDRLSSIRRELDE